MMPTVLFIKGIRDDKTVKVISLDNENIIFNVGGSSNIYNFIDNNRFQKAIITLDSKLNSAINTMGCSVMFNQISDFDTYKISLNKVSNMLQQLGDKVICINRPEYIQLTTRDSVSQLLQGIDKLTVPQTIRITPRSPADILTAIDESELKFPLLIRESGRHGGDRTALLKSDEEVNNLFSFALDGRDFYLTAFHDFSEVTAATSPTTIEDNNKVYKKCRLAVIDGKPYLRHLIISDKWMIHSNSRTYMDENPAYKTEELNYLNDFHDKVEPLIQPIINAIHERIKLEYFGIDCNIREDGSILLFEANATMNILLNNVAPPNIWQLPIESIKDAIIDMIAKRISAS